MRAVHERAAASPRAERVGDVVRKLVEVLGELNLVAHTT
jgi:hypothetical protein